MLHRLREVSSRARGRAEGGLPEDLSALEKDLRAAGPSVRGGGRFAETEACADDDLLWHALSGRRMEGVARERLEDHLVRCDGCRTLVAEAARAPDAIGAVERDALRTEPPDVAPYVQPSRQGRRWLRGAAWMAPAAALALYAVIMLSVPRASMQLLVEPADTIRSSGGTAMEDGAVLRAGDRFRVEIRARKDGYFFVYLWEEADPGTFLFPSAEILQGNWIEAGNRVFVPASGAWEVDDQGGGDEGIYLLYSERPVEPEAISGIQRDLERGGSDRAGVERILSRHFSIEQNIRYRHE